MKRNQYTVCPCCGKNKLVAFDAQGNLLWADYDPKTMEFIQVREGGGKTGTGMKGRGQGKGIGFPKIASMTLEDAIRAGGTAQKVAQDVAQRLIEVSREFRRLGLIP